MSSIKGKNPELPSFDFDFDESSLDGLGELDTLEEELSAVTEELANTGESGSRGKTIYAAMEKIQESSQPPKFYSSIKELCKEENWTPTEAAAKQKEGNIAIGHLAPLIPGEKKQKAHLPPEIKAIADEYGIDVDGNHFNPNDIDVIAWTPEQMARINKVADAAFTNLAKAYETHQNKLESGDNTLKDKTIKHIKDEKPLVTKDKFPDLAKLKAESDKKARRAEQRRDEEFATESKRAAEKKTKKLDDDAERRNTFYLLRDEHNVENKKDDKTLDLNNG